MSDDDLRARTEANMKRCGIPKGMHDPAADEWMRREAARIKADDLVERLRRPIDPSARMDAYYFGFDRTGVGIIDAVLSAVATAGKGYHHTESWSDVDKWVLDGKTSYVDLIQNAAADAASTARQAANEIERLRTDNAKMAALAAQWVDEYVEQAE